MRHFWMIWVLVGVAMLTAGGLAARMQFIVPPYPATFTNELTATGRLESVRILGVRQRYCRLDVIVHTWINLSPGFPIRDMPQPGDQVSLFGSVDMCVAAQVSAAGAEGHILYRAGEGGARQWFLTERPSAALRCGGRLG